MNKATPIPLGFYYHYKHDPAGEINNYAYEVVGVALDTEKISYSVVYRPLYTDSFFDGADFCFRSIEMFMEQVEIDGVRIPRFEKISDPETISALERIKTDMYGKIPA